MPFVVFDANGRIKDIGATGSNGLNGATGAQGLPGAALFELAEDGEDGAISIVQRSPQSFNGIIQIVQTTVQSLVTLNSGNAGTWVASGLSLSITPRATTSKILLRALLSVELAYSGSGNFPQLGVRLFNNTASSVVEEWDIAAISPDSNATMMVPVEFLDSPASALAINYIVQVQLFTTPSGGSQILVCPIGGVGNRGISVLTAEEFGSVTV